jgi:putative FmdB family regulatory protein
MPIYLYRCKRCGHTTEKLRGMNEKDKETMCAACGSKDVEKVTSSFYGPCCSSAGNYRFG